MSPSILSFFDLRFFCRSECMLTLTSQLMYCSFFKKLRLLAQACFRCFIQRRSHYIQLQNVDNRDNWWNSIGAKYRSPWKKNPSQVPLRTLTIQRGLSQGSNSAPCKCEYGSYRGYELSIHCRLQLAGKKLSLDHTANFFYHPLFTLFYSGRVVSGEKRRNMFGNDHYSSVSVQKNRYR
jgi:hypothetical protein